jgi:DNA repair protein RadC
LRVAAVLDISLVDHLIVGEDQQYYSFRTAGRLGATPADR